MSHTSMPPTPALASWAAGTHTAEVAGRATTHPTYRKGHGPGVIIIHEMPGLTDGVIRFAEEVVAAGYTVVLPHLFGPIGRTVSGGDVMRTLPKICVNREFTKIAVGRTAPVADWLRSLAVALHEELGGPGVGALGMCFTGGYALAMMVESATVAPVLCQPSTPFAFGQTRAADLGLSPADLNAVVRRAADGCSVLGVRYRSDRATGTRFDTLTDLLGDRFLKVELDGEGHSTVTEQRSQDAVDSILSFFASTLDVAGRVDS